MATHGASIINFVGVEIKGDWLLVTFCQGGLHHNNAIMVYSRL